jgi:Flp pilus assembly protein TadG
MSNGRAKNNLTLALDESGAAAVIIAIVLAVLCGVIGLAVDIGHMVMVKGELQRTADAGALAGAAGLAPYNNPGPNQTPNWVQGQNKANAIITNSANTADNQIITDGTVLGGYWLLKPPTNYTQLPLSTVRPTNSTYMPEPAINVTLSKNVTLYLAPLVGVSSPKMVSATATAILPEVYGVTGVPPIGVDIDTVYNIGPGGSLKIDFNEQDIQPQSNKGIAGWINLSGDNSVPSVRFDAPMFASPTGVLTNSKVYFTPGTEATLMGSLVQVGETLILPVVDSVESKQWKNIITWSAFKVDSKDANSMTGHFEDIGYVPGQKPDERPAGYPLTPFISGTPKLVGP